MLIRMLKNDSVIVNNLVKKYTDKNFETYLLTNNHTDTGRLYQHNNKKEMV